MGRPDSHAVLFEMVSNYLLGARRLVHRITELSSTDQNGLPGTSLRGGQIRTQFYLINDKIISSILLYHMEIGFV